MLVIGNALSDLLCAVLKKAEKDGASTIPPAYRRLIRYMENNYMYKLSLDDLADQFHISKYHLSREFRKYTGYSPGEYLIMLRIQHASILLAQSELSVKTIAAQAGFSNMSNFIGQIKKRTGMTPSAHFRVRVGIRVRRKMGGLGHHYFTLKMKESADFLTKTAL